VVGKTCLELVAEIYCQWRALMGMSNDTSAAAAGPVDLLRWATAWAWPLRISREDRAIASPTRWPVHSDSRRLIQGVRPRRGHHPLRYPCPYPPLPLTLPCGRFDGLPVHRNTFPFHGLPRIHRRVASALSHFIIDDFRDHLAPRSTTASSARLLPRLSAASRRGPCSAISWPLMT
jgi:hypothetical protein